MAQTIPCVLMRGGTSRGPFFLGDWLPSDPAGRDRALIAALGSPHELQIDGLGGGNSLTSKVAIVSRSSQPGCDVDYLFAQVSIDEERVDVAPNCGNMLAGVGPFAIEQGLVPAREGSTRVNIFNVNTRSRIEAEVMTPGGRVSYDGDQRIDGVPGTAAPIRLAFANAWGAVTGHVFPTGQRSDVIDGIEVTCIDAAQVMVMVRAADLGLAGDEAPAALDANAPLMARLEALRRAAGLRMGMGDVSRSVLPKPVIVSPGAQPGTIVSRYFTPLRCHRSHAATGAIGVAAALALPGSVAADARWTPGPGSHRVGVLHPAGCIPVDLELGGDAASPTLQRASLVRTARKILEGTLYIPVRAAAA